MKIIHHLLLRWVCDDDEGNADDDDDGKDDGNIEDQDE